MGMGISIFIGAIGAILRYAMTGSSQQSGFDLHTGGVILMFVGALGLVLSMLFWSPFAPFGRRDTSTTLREERTILDGHAQDSVVRETRDHMAG